MRALITGASSPIAKSLIPLLIEKGYSLCLVVRELKSFADPISSITYFQADLFKKEDQKKIFDLIQHEFFDLIIQNAGAGYYGEATEQTHEEIQNILELNAIFPILLTRLACKIFKEQKKGGIILNVSSLVDHLSYPFFATYASSKAALTHFSRALHAENKSHGILVLVSSPGQIRTPFQRKASRGFFDGKEDSRAMTPEYVAKRLLRQIIKKTSYDRFPWQTKVMITFLNMLPRSLRDFFLKQSLADRIR